MRYGVTSQRRIVPAASRATASAGRPACPDNGKVVRFVNGFPDFTVHRHPKVPSEIKIAYTDSPVNDYKAAFNKAKEMGLLKDSDLAPGTKTWAPAGYTWHHNQKLGIMELVDSSAHSSLPGGAGHTGGRAIFESLSEHGIVLPY